MSRLAGWLLVIIGVFVATFYALLPPDPCRGTCPASVAPLQPVFPPNPAVIGIISIVLGVLALATGLLSLARGGAIWTSSLLAIVGLFLLVQRFLWSPGPLATAAVATYPAAVAWLSVAIGVVALVAGLIGFVRGDASARAAR